MAYDTTAIDELQASLQEYIKQIRPQLAESARQKGEQERKSWEENQALPRAALGAALAYGTGGLASMLPVAAGGAGASVLEAMAPNVMNIGSAISGGIKGYGTKDTTGAALAGMGTGIEPALKRVEEQRSADINLKDPEQILKRGKMKTDILKYAEPLSGTLEPGEELPNDVFELEGILPGVKYFRYRKQPNYIQQFIQGGGEQ